MRGVINSGVAIDSDACGLAAVSLDAFAGVKRAVGEQVGEPVIESNADKLAADKLSAKAAIQAAISQATIFKIGIAHTATCALVGLPVGLPTGFGLLDAQLPGGGWPHGALVEILCDAQGCGEVSLLLPALLSAVEVSAKKVKTKLKNTLNNTPNNTLKTPVLWVSPPYLPYAPGLMQAGLDMQGLTIIDVPRNEDALWAAEQALASGAYRRVCMWLRGSLSDTSLRRLHYAAGVGGAHCWLMRPLTAASQPSPAPLRIAVQALADGYLQLRLLKLRGMKPGKTIVLSTRKLDCLCRDEAEIEMQMHTALNGLADTKFAPWMAEKSDEIPDKTSSIIYSKAPELAVRQRAELPDR